MEEMRKKIESAIGRLAAETVSLRTGRASPALIEDLEVDYYGVPTALKAIAALSTPEPRTIVIRPWDKHAVPAIEKAIHASSLGLNPVAEREIIRVSIPILTEDRRKELVRLLGRFVEDARIRVRMEREEALRSIDRRAKEGTISEDQKFREKEEIQKTVDEANEKIGEIKEKKEAEIVTV